RQYFFGSCSLQDVLDMHQDIAGRPGSNARRTMGSAAQRHASVDRRSRVDAALGRRSPSRLGRRPRQPGLAPMFGEWLPRNLDCIYEINRRFPDEVHVGFPEDEARVRRMSLIGEEGAESVRMAHLATVGSHAVNGVAALHTELLKSSVLKD